MSFTRSVLHAEKLFGRRILSSRPFVVSFSQSSITMPTGTYQQSVRLFHSSHIALAKPKKGGKKGGNDDEEPAQLPDLTSTKKKMEQVIDRYTQEISKFKVGRASVDMFGDVQVGSYGSVASAGQVTVKSATSVSIAVYDPSMVKTVADAVRDCGMGFSPTIENSVVTVFIPKPSKESRDALIKSVSKAAEKSKLDVRQLRKSILDDVKKVKGAVSADDSKRFTKEVETVTEKNVDKITQLTNAKEKEIMA